VAYIRNASGTLVSNFLFICIRIVVVASFMSCPLQTVQVLSTDATSRTHTVQSDWCNSLIRYIPFDSIKACVSILLYSRDLSILYESFRLLFVSFLSSPFIFSCFDFEILYTNHISTVHNKGEAKPPKRNEISYTQSHSLASFSPHSKNFSKYPYLCQLYIAIKKCHHASNTNKSGW
jgi:hypothetical protein